MAGAAPAHQSWPVVTPVGPELPDLPERYIPRRRVERRLAAAVAEARVTTIVAPAVSGKTTLIAGWIATAETLPLAYVALDAYDNELARFCSKLVGSLQHVHPGYGASALAELATTGDPRRFLDMLLPELSRMGRTVVALDGFEAISSPEVQRVVGDILVGLPDSLRIILSSRSEPPLRLGLLRARGQLVEIPAADLAFDPSEVAAFLEEFDAFGFGPDETLALYERTEGWPGGVTLAALAAAHHDDSLSVIRGFSGSNRYVADLLNREVLEPQPPPIRDFLLVTGILDVLDPKLCDLVTGRSDSGSVLDRLERSGLFTEAIDDQRSRFRYAPLFGEFLRRELQVLDPERAREAHRTAAVELERRGEISGAITHFEAADLASEGIRLLLAHGQTFAATGEVESLRGWLTVLPDKALTEDVGQMLQICYLCVAAGLDEEATVWLDRAALRLDEHADAELSAWHALLVGYRYAQLGNLESAVSQGHRVLTLLDDAGSTNAALRGWAHHLMAAACAGLDQFEAAHRHLTAAPFETRGEVPTDSYSAWLCYREGRLDRAMDHANRVLDSDLPPWQWPTVLVSRGAVRRERNHLEEADDDLTQAIELARRWSRPRVTVFGSIERALVRYAQGRATEAFEGLAIARHDVHGTYLGQLLEVTEAGLRLREGDLERCEVLRSELPDGRLTALLDIRVALAQGRLDEARRLVDAYEGRARSVRDRISSHLLRARAGLGADETDVAEHLRWAVDLGRRERFVQVFVEDLEPLGGLLRQMPGAADDPYVYGLLAAMTEENNDASVDPRLTESLSRREQIVLRYLPTSLSNKQIASELHMSVNTLKTHLKSVYRKLGVGSREEAVAHARHLHML